MNDQEYTKDRATWVERAACWLWVHDDMNTPYCNTCGKLTGGRSKRIRWWSR